MSKRTKRSCHFKSVEDFYNATRPEVFEEKGKGAYDRLIETVGDPSPAEKESWRKSLPDLAGLLFDQNAYYKETKTQCGRYVNLLAFARLVFEKLSDETSFLDFISSEYCGSLMQVLQVKDELAREEDLKENGVRKVLNKETAGYLKAMKEGLEVLNDIRINEACIAEMAREEDYLEAQKNRQFTALDGKIEAEVDLEYKLGRSNRRIDVLLSDPQQKKYVIIELKQWTEESIEVSEDGQSIMIKDYKEQMHPALKVRDDYRERLKKSVGDDAKILCLVYLHNQYYENGQMFSVPDEVKYEKEAINGQKLIMYTRMHCDSFVKRIYDFFQQ